MDAVERMPFSFSSERAESDLVLTRAGVALPRVARARSTAPRQRGVSAPLRCSVRSFTIRTPGVHGILEQAFQLRAEVFQSELGWLMSSADGRERDRCDAVARHFVALEHVGDGAPPRLAGYARALLPAHGFMLQREFIELLGEQPFTPDVQRAFEVSRFVVHPALRGVHTDDGRSVTEHLARGIAQWALLAGRDQWYTVCETRYLRALRLRALEFKPFGQPVEYQPGVEARAVALRLAAIAAAMRARRPLDYAWYLGQSANGSAMADREHVR